MTDFLHLPQWQFTFACDLGKAGFLPISQGQMAFASAPPPKAKNRLDHRRVSTFFQVASGYFSTLPAEAKDLCRDLGKGGFPAPLPMA